MNTRDELLLALKNAPGWKSGEELSRKMAMTRSAVWKHIGKLREEGYNIESSPKKGYRLADSDVLAASAVREGLAQGIFGRQEMLFLRQTPSTNQEARRLAEKGAPEGTLVVAETQVSGKGRRGRQWFSPAGLGLYFSFILRPALAPAEAAKITLLMSVSAAEALTRKTGLAARIKWPNDILVNGRKIAGILAELSAEPDSINYIVMGVGVNVNVPPHLDYGQSPDGKLPEGRFPEELQPIATSVLIETGQTCPRGALLVEMLRDFDAKYAMARADGFRSALRRWRELSDITGKKIRVDTATESVAGTVVELDRDGALVLRDQRGAVRRFLSGDIVQEKR